MRRFSSHLRNSEWVSRVKIDVMKRAGKVSPLVILGVVGFVGILAVVLLTRTGTSPAQRVSQFFTALGKGDIETVLQTSTFGEQPDEEMRPKWQQTLDRSKYYRFAMQIKETTYTNDEEATVAVEMYQNVTNINVASKRFQIPVVKINGEWKVDARSLTRQAYPALPR